MRWNRNTVARMGRWVIAVVIIGAVSWHFARLLRRPELWDNPPPLHPEWLVATVGGYVAALCLWGAFWWRLLGATKETVAWTTAARAYFLSQLGKYIPGKALAIVLRVWIVRRAGVRPAVAAVTAVYETLTAMTSGCLLAIILIPIVTALSAQHQWTLLGLLLLAGLPIFPGIFNRLAHRAAHPFLAPHSSPLPTLSLRQLVSGLAQTCLGWLVLGMSLKATLHSLGHEGLPWLTCTAYVAFAYVAGFLTLPAPGGLGVREALLQQLLAASLADSMGRPQGDGFAAVVALSLRLWWTIAEVTLAGLALAAPRVIQRIRPEVRP